MATKNITFVEDLDAKKDFINVKVRIIKRWRQPWKLDMVLIDEKGKKIQASVKKDLIPNLEPLIKEDTVVFINRCGVGVNDDTFPVVKNKLKLNFYKCTEVVRSHSFSGHPYGFDFVPFKQITAALAKNPEVLNVDVIGSVTWCGNLEVFNSSKGKECKKFDLHLKDLEGNICKCTLWGDYAIQFNNFVEKNTSTEHVITIMQRAVVKEWKNHVTVQSDMFGTRIFINEEIAEANDLRRSLILKEGNAATSSALSSQTVYPNRLEFLLNTEQKHVDEVREAESPMECVVLGTIAMLEQEFGWFYVGCRKCNKKVINKQEFLESLDIENVTDDVINAPIESLWCPKEKAIATDLVPKFRVTFRVQDATGSASFLMFDKDVSKILGLSAYDIRERQLKSNEIGTYPHELNGLLNKKIAFKITVSTYNLEKNYTIYTVNKICDDPQVINELAAKDSVNEVSEDTQLGEVNQETQVPEFSTVKLSESSQGISSKDAFSVTGDSLAVDQEKDTETSPLQKRSNVTPGVESTTKVSKKMRKINMPK